MALDAGPSPRPLLPIVVAFTTNTVSERWAAGGRRPSGAHGRVGATVLSGHRREAAGGVAVRYPKCSVIDPRDIRPSRLPASARRVYAGAGGG
jgi:hypothetical protein